MTVKQGDLFTDTTCKALWMCLGDGYYVCIVNRDGNAQVPWMKNPQYSDSFKTCVYLGNIADLFLNASGPNK